jgi:lipid A 3-O-deacylase
MGKRFLIAAITGLCVIIPALTAQADSETIRARDVVKQGVIELGLNAGFLQGTDAIPSSLSNRNATYVLPRIGMVLTRDMGKDLFLGNFELQFEPTYAHYWHPFQADLAGGTVVFKYNFLAFGRWMPFWDFGLGALWTDLAPRIPEQSTQFNFLIEGGPGVQYFVTERIALTMGVRLQHISNAFLGERNRGLNSTLGYVGISFFLPQS